MSNAAPPDLVREIDSLSNILKDQNFYERLGVDVEADTKTIKKAYTQLAAKWHPDRYSSYELGERAGKLQSIFALFTEANTVLTNPRKRETYDTSLRMGMGGASNVDPRSIFQADAAFKLGTQLMDGGKYKAAMEKFQEASELNPDSNIFKSYLLYVTFQSLSRNAKGKPLDKNKAHKIKEEILDCCAEIEDFDMGYFFQGMIALSEGNDKHALRQFRIARSINPKNVHAKRQLRLLEMRKNKSKSFLDVIKGLFGGGD